MFSPIFVLTECASGQITEVIIFVRDRIVISFGRSSSCEYRILGDRSEGQNLRVSRIQATLQKQDDEWLLYPGCTERSARNGIVPGPPASPLFIGSASVSDEFVKMSLERSVYLYREVDDYVTLLCTDEKGLELRSQTSSIECGTQSHDLIEELRDDLRTDMHRMEELVLDGFSEMKSIAASLQGSVANLQTSEQIQNNRLDTHSSTIFKVCFAGVLIVLALVGGSQLLDPNSRKEFTYDMVKLLVSAGSGVGGAALLKDTIDKRSK